MGVIQTDQSLCGKHWSVNITQASLCWGTLVLWVFLCVTASPVAAAFRAAGCGSNRGPFVQHLGLGYPRYRDKPVPVSKTHEVLMRLAACLRNSCGWRRVRCGGRCSVHVGSAISCTWHVCRCDFTLSSKCQNCLWLGINHLNVLHLKHPPESLVCATRIN